MRSLASLVVASPLFTLLVACGSAAPGQVRTIGGRPLAVQHDEAGAVRLVGFVNPTRGSREDAGARFAVSLEDRDWLAAVGPLMRLSPDGRDVRWARPDIEPWDAVVSGGRAYIVGTIDDPDALNGERRAILALDLATGDVAWEVAPRPIVRGASAEIVFVGDAIVAASAYGEAGTGADGVVRWTHDREESDDEARIAVAPVSRPTVVVTTTPRFYQSDDLSTPRRAPLAVRTIDAVSGQERGRLELPPDGDYWHLGLQGVARDGRIAVRVSDQRYYREGSAPALRQRSRPGVLIIEAAEPDHPGARFVELAATRPASPWPTMLASSEVLFLQGYAGARERETVGVEIFDLDTESARYCVVAEPRPLSLHDEEVSSFMQVLQSRSDRDGVSFAGIFVGDVLPLRGWVYEMDACDAADGVECFWEPHDVVITPSAGFIGTIRFAP